jgi:hypothetical protein
MGVRLRYWKGEAAGCAVLVRNLGYAGRLDILISVTTLVLPLHALQGKELGMNGELLSVSKDTPVKAM